MVTYVDLTGRAMMHLRLHLPINYTMKLLCFFSKNICLLLSIAVQFASIVININVLSFILYKIV